MTKWLKKTILSGKSLENSFQLKKVKSYFKDARYLSKDRESVARGVAAGLAGCLIPGFQLFYAAVLAFLLRGNLPIALVCTLVTNPLTVVPIMYGIYLIGSLIVGNNQNGFVVEGFKWDFSSSHAFLANAGAWLSQFGKAFLVGLPVVSICLGMLGYLLTHLIWEISLYFKKK